MAYINLALSDGEQIVDGKVVTFKAPCDCNVPDGIKIGEDIYTIVDSMGAVVTTAGSYFCKDAIVSVILDTTENKAFVLNSAQTLIVKQTGPLVNINPSYDGGAKVEGLVHNLLPYPYADFGESLPRTVTGITFEDNGDGGIHVSGTATASTYYRFTEVNNLEGGIKNPGTYTFASNSESGKVIVAVDKRSKADGTYVTRFMNNMESGTFEITSADLDEYFALCAIGVNSGDTVDEVVYPMLEAGSVAHPYVPYSGYEVKAVGKNLLPYPYHDNDKSYSRGVYYTVNEDKTVTANGTANGEGGNANWYFVQNYSMLKKDVTYTLTGCPSSGSTSTYCICIYDGDAESFIGYDTGNGKTFTPTKDYENVRIYIRVMDNVTVENLVFKPMLKVGSDTEDIEFEPYVSKSIPVTNETDKVYLPTYDGVTNIFTDYGIDLDVEYGCNEAGAQVYAGKLARHLKVKTLTIDDSAVISWDATDEALKVSFL